MNLKHGWQTLKSSGNPFSLWEVAETVRSGVRRVQLPVDGRSSFSPWSRCERGEGCSSSTQRLNASWSARFLKLSWMSWHWTDSTDYRSNAFNFGADGKLNIYWAFPLFAEARARLTSLSWIDGHETWWREDDAACDTTDRVSACVCAPWSCSGENACQCRRRRKRLDGKRRSRCIDLNTQLKFIKLLKRRSFTCIVLLWVKVNPSIIFGH